MIEPSQSIMKLTIPEEYDNLKQDSPIKRKVSPF